MDKKNKRKPITPSERFHFSAEQEGLSKDGPERRLCVANHRKKGRNVYGRITSRRRGGGHKRMYRLIDFKRNKLDIAAKVTNIEYDPNRSANIALLCYADGEKRYILCPKGLQVGDSVFNTSKPVEDYSVGTRLLLKDIPLATKIHAVELIPKRGAQIARGAGSFVQLVALEKGYATLKMPSGELRRVSEECCATIGQVGNENHRNGSLGKAGRNRWLGRRPRVRGVAMNPVDHPMGGGEGRTSGGGHPVSPWGQLAKGYKTRSRRKTSNRNMIVDRRGRKVKQR